MISTNITGCCITHSQSSDGDMRDVHSMRVLLPSSTQTLCVPKLMHATDVQEAAPNTIQTCDVLYTQHPQIALGLRVADCLPIVLSAQGKGIMIIHGGWRSLLQGIMEKSLRVFYDNIHNVPQDYDVWIGPSLHACCNTMRVIPEQQKHAQWHPYIRQNGEEYSVDLHAYVRDVCLSFQIPPTHIRDTKICTFHERDTYFSYRKYTQEQSNDINQHTVPHIGVVAWMIE